MLSDNLTIYPKSAKTRIQANTKGKGKDELSMLAVMSRIYKQEGIRGLYRGFGATMLNTFSMRRLIHLYNFVQLTFDFQNTLTSSFIPLSERLI